MKTEAFAGIIRTETGLKPVWANYPPIDYEDYTVFASKIIAEKQINDCGFKDKIAVKL